jgi:hypothetical protein
MSEFSQAELTDRLAKDAANLASLGVPVHTVGEVFVTVGLRFELAAHGARAVADRLAAACEAMRVLADEVDAQPTGSTASH